MSAQTSIQWTDRTWNPVRGCSVVSPGCVNCYAMKQAHRFSGPGKPYAGLTKLTKAGPQWTGKISLAYDALDEPRHWRKPARVFVNSMSDLFHEDVPDDFIDRVVLTMTHAVYHTFQILTKRPERMREYFSATNLRERIDRIGLINNPVIGGRGKIPPTLVRQWPLLNVWLGVSVEDQTRADERIPLLLQTPAAVRFISAEPLLGPVDLNGLPDPKGDPSWDATALHGLRECAFGATVQRESIPKLDWVIVGGESGPNARPFHLDWARQIVKACGEAKVACFVKQIGSNPKYFHLGGTSEVTMLSDRKGGDPSEWPLDLRVRQFPLLPRETGET